MNNIKRISLMTAIFLTVALVSSAVEAGVIRINGTIAGTESGAPFPNPAEGFYVNGSVTSTDTALGPFTLVYSVPVAFAFAGTPPGNVGASRLIVGDAANGDSILTWFLGNNRGSCANGDLRLVDPDTIIGGTGRYAGARGSFTTGPMLESCDRRDQRCHQRHHRRKRTVSVGRPLPNRRRA